MSDPYYEQELADTLEAERPRRQPKRCPWCGLSLKKYGHAVCRDLEAALKKTRGDA